MKLIGAAAYPGVMRRPILVWSFGMADAYARRWLIFGAMSLMFFVVSGGAFASLGVVLPAMVQDLPVVKK